MKNSFTDPFGNIIFIKRFLMSTLGAYTYRLMNRTNNMNVIGGERLLDLPQTNVMFVANHETYFLDVVALYHIFSSSGWGDTNIDRPRYLWWTRPNSYFVAAEETMKSSFLAKLFAYTGAVTVKRSWRSNGKAVSRGADMKAVGKVKKALDTGWVINFPQGTTQYKAPNRKGAANLILQYQPIVIPVQFRGFRKAFHKKGLKSAVPNSELYVEFGEPIQFNDSHTLEDVRAYLDKHIVSDPTFEPES